MKFWIHSRAAAVAALLVAGWPVLRWYAARMTDGSDEPWGLLALIAALWFAPRAGWSEPLPPRRRTTLSALVLLYAASFGVLPPLARALAWATSLGFAMGGKRFPFAWWMLLALSLPLMASVQFYLGYPLRWATAWLCVPLLRLGGVAVTAAGCTLRAAGEAVIVDAPCSGIHMGWTGLFLASVLACRGALSNAGTAVLLRRAGALVFCANVLRATALFCFESHLWPSTPWVHEGVGLAIFAAAAGSIVCAVPRASNSAANWALGASSP